MEGLHCTIRIPPEPIQSNRSPPPLLGTWGMEMESSSSMEVNYLVLYEPSLRRCVLAQLHDSHCAVEATKRRAIQINVKRNHYDQSVLGSTCVSRTRGRNDRTTWAPWGENEDHETLNVNINLCGKSCRLSDICAYKLFWFTYISITDSKNDVGNERLAAAVPPVTAIPVPYVYTSWSGWLVSSNPSGQQSPPVRMHEIKYST